MASSQEDKWNNCQERIEALEVMKSCHIDKKELLLTMETEVLVQLWSLTGLQNSMFTI